MYYLLNTKVDGVDTIASADVNTLMGNIEALKGGASGVAPLITLSDLYKIAVTKTTSYTITDIDCINRLYGDTTGGAFTVTLPLKANNVNRIITIAHAKGSSAITVATNASDPNTLSFDGLATIVLNLGDSITLQENATTGKWELIEERVTTSYVFDTHAGYGSAQTQIQQFTNNPVAKGNYITTNHGSYGTAGLNITIQRTGKYFIQYINQAPMYFGITLNSAQLSTSFATITGTTRLSAATNATTNYIQNAPCIVNLVKGNILYPHTNAAAPTAASALLRIEYIN